MAARGTGLKTMLAARFVGSFLKKGAMVIIDHNGGHHFCGQLGETPVVVVRFTNRSIALRFLLNPQVAAGEGYTRGEIVLEKSCPS